MPMSQQRAYDEKTGEHETRRLDGSVTVRVIVMVMVVGVAVMVGGSIAVAPRGGAACADRRMVVPVVLVVVFHDDPSLPASGTGADANGDRAHARAGV